MLQISFGYQRVDSGSFIAVPTVNLEKILVNSDLVILPCHSTVNLVGCRLSNVEASIDSTFILISLPRSCLVDKINFISFGASNRGPISGTYNSMSTKYIRPSVSGIKTNRCFESLILVSRPDSLCEFASLARWLIKGDASKTVEWNTKNRN